jgi:photosystem II protein PsbQ
MFGRFRTLLALVLVVMTTFLVSCSSAKVQGPLYSDAQLTQIQSFVSTVQADLNRLQDNLPGMIEKSDWSDVRAYIHGPMGELGTRMSRLARSLAPSKVQKQALDLAHDVFDDLTALDTAAAEDNLRGVQQNFSAAIQDIEALINLAPASEA